MRYLRKQIAVTTDGWRNTLLCMKVLLKWNLQKKF